MAAVVVQRPRQPPHTRPQPGLGCRRGGSGRVFSAGDAAQRMLLILPDLNVYLSVCTCNISAGVAARPPPPPCSVEYTLEVLRGGSLLHATPVAERDHYTFGRTPDCDVVVEHPSASRLHAVLQYNGETKVWRSVDATKGGNICSDSNWSGPNQEKKGGAAAG